MKLSIIIPCYNERSTILEVINKVQNLTLPVEKEVIVICDGSSDGTAELLKNFSRSEGQKIKIIYHEKNMGKGRAIISGVKIAAGNYLIIQDADFELDPNDYCSLLKPILKRESEVVFGSRRKKGYKKMYFHSKLANYIVTWLANILYGSRLTDISCGYKLLPVPLFRNLGLKCRGFEFCTEITAKLLCKKYNIYEVPVEYYPRTYAQGKKILWKDGFFAIKTLLINRIKFYR